MIERNIRERGKKGIDRGIGNTSRWVDDDDDEDDDDTGPSIETAE